MTNTEVSEICDLVYDTENESVALDGEFNAETLQSIVDWMRKTERNRRSDDD